MIRCTIFAGRKVAVFGLGLSGLASVEALLAGGADVAAWDDGASGRGAAQAMGLALTDLNHADWREFSALVLAPGVPLTHPAPHWTVQRARDAGIPIIGDTELFFRERAARCPGARVIAITGTNGKSTTTALTAHILRASGAKVAMGGNIGKAVLSLAPLHDDQIYVLELSSYQLDLTPSIHCDAAALLNLSPDHLDRHGDMARYSAIKALIFSKMGANDTAVIGVDDDHCRAIYEDMRAGDKSAGHTIAVSMTGQLADGIYGADDQLFEAHGADMCELTSLAGIQSLRGTHNWQNAAVAIALARGIGRTVSDMALGLRSFPGLAHRMEILGTRERVLFVNDSKGTNADAAQKALSAFNDIYWIAGGRSKQGGIEPLRPHFSRIAKAYLIGEATADFASTLTGSVEFEICATLARATECAARDAASSRAAEPVVMLSPACASFDQYRSFELRGDQFRELVGALPGINLNPRGET